MGRPTKLTQKLGDAICEQLAEGISLRTICLDPKMPDKSQVFRWLNDARYADFRDQYTRAKEAAADAMAEDIIDIAEDGSNDWMEKRYGDRVETVVNHEALGRSQLRIETRKWLMSKIMPKKYSERFQVDSTITKKLEDLTDDELIAEAKARADQVHKLLG